MAIAIKQIDRLADRFLSGERIVVVRVAATSGSAPRNEDAVMVVGAGMTGGATVGTIGGGQLEWIAIARARAILAGAEAEGAIDVPLGPEIGQCCGGRVRLSFHLLDSALLEQLRLEATEMEACMPRVLIFGAGHTGTALAAAMAPLPVRTMLIDSRADVFQHPGAPVETLSTPLPEEAVREAPAGSAFVTMTHEHSLDFLITAEALRRGDAAYVGMIGSATKRAVFLNWLDDNGYRRALGARLVCPIGGNTVRDKRPEVIAALTAAEILAALHAVSSESIP